jgi:chorismate synthase
MNPWGVCCVSSSYGDRVRISIFGQSHGEAIGVTIDGLPAGEAVDLAVLAAFLQRRAPGRSSYATPRREADLPEILSGLVDGYTCGAPLCAVIRNTNTRSGDYAQLADLPRPGHADYPAAVKHGGYNDVRGGGHFSARLTAPLCIAGGILIQLLARRGVEIGGHIASVAGVQDSRFDPVNVTSAQLHLAGEKAFPVLDDAAGETMKARITTAAAEKDSVGGTVECGVLGLPVGLGEPVFDGLENELAKVIFAIPAVKGIEFGAGFAAAALRGSQNNDPYAVRDGKVVTLTNNHGGILGGLTSGMPLLFRAAFKPTPSIAREQQTVSLSRMEETALSVTGRHDPCVVPRAVPCVEAAAAIAIANLLL